MNLRLKRAPGLYLVGYIGSGKTTIGRHLARRLGWSFFDLDEEIEAAEKTAVGDLLAARGEAEFRRIESQVLLQHVRAIERGRPAVLALGDGAFDAEANRALIFENGIAIWLECGESRREIYALADVHIAVDGDRFEDAVEAILNHPILR
jgi:shikimate kinase